MAKIRTRVIAHCDRCPRIAEHWLDGAYDNITTQIPPGWEIVGHGGDYDDAHTLILCPGCRKLLLTVTSVESDLP